MRGAIAVKPLLLVALCGLAVLPTGCAELIPPLEDRAEANAALVNGVFDDAIRNAVIRQHTLFEYHFLRNAATLNELGKHDLGLIAAYYKEHPGPLNVRQGDAADELHEARINEAKRVLIESGVDRERVTVKDGLPGGDGMPVERALVIAAPSGAATSKKATHKSGQK